MMGIAYGYAGLPLLLRQLPRLRVCNIPGTHCGRHPIERTIDIVEQFPMSVDVKLYSVVF